MLKIEITLFLIISLSTVNAQACLRSQRLLAAKFNGNKNGYNNGSDNGNFNGFNQGENNGNLNGWNVGNWNGNVNGFN